ncbi:phosphotransferase enzyme family protein [Pseudodesulfovibrio portus]|uniref:Aminoglycoside phosphotransferase n=1 Tax=Pseudodesulfovibrio portus TaxID=231439 RepID=A0ABM8AR45_9BACT|nr:phosphotransferase [Pseudodesulfovibrio portus]BDQ33868.1 aminoglycoside phosphotransferase [Pseudodesulfovibrio portus]
MIDMLFLWGLAPARPRTDLFLPGSPERCVQRQAVEDEDGNVWMIEKLRPGQWDRREKIGILLHALAQAGLPVPAYLPGPRGRFAPEVDGNAYHLSPYIPGDPLPQPEFIEDADRGTGLGRFLADLRGPEHAAAPFSGEPELNLEDYINELMGAMRTRRPEVREGLLPVLPALAPLFEAWPHLPRALCQGDFHPLNVIWRGTGVAAVIDWEFCGIRPALFDAANCLGCVGIEDPPALVRGLAPALLRELRDRDRLDPDSLALLPELILALRFAWMSEWLRRGDGELADLELRYMRLLSNSIDTLLPAWKQLLS